MDGLILAFKIYMFTWIFSPLSLLWRQWLSKSCYQNLKHHSLYFVLTQRRGKYVYSITESGWYFSVFSVHMTYVWPLFLQLWHMIILLIILIMAWCYHFWHIKFSKVSIYFILSSEINAYLQRIKRNFFTSEMMLYQFTSEWYDLCLHCSENLKIPGP